MHDAFGKRAVSEDFIDPAGKITPLLVKREYLFRDKFEQA